MRRTHWLAVVIALGLLPAGAGAERASFGAAEAGVRERTVAEVLRGLQRDSGVEILWPASIGERRTTADVNGVPVVDAVRRVLRGLPDVSPDSLAVLYETGNPTPKLIWILGSEGGGPSVLTASSAPAEPEPRFLPPAEAPRYVPLRHEPVHVPEDPSPRDVPIETEPAYLP